MGKANVYQTELKVSVIPQRFPHRGGWLGCTKRSVPIDPSVGHGALWTLGSNAGSAARLGPTYPIRFHAKRLFQQCLSFGCPGVGGNG
ncbi:hypothetical protein [Candidatus Thiosymbion oneisti]|uniref:hypothetical protein n=1 Tax=Candidatus Thiosymbion oneisti TaxID=589554 RepID=UPI001A9CA002|nr:hypothetical protein [Candidatus Thiosymbion oneisti]